MMVDQAAAERMIRAHLHDSTAQEPLEDGQSASKMLIEESKENKPDAPQSQSKDKGDLYELDEWDAAEIQKDKPKAGKKLHKGSLLPSGSHLSWKDQVEKMLK